MSCSLFDKTKWNGKALSSLAGQTGSLLLEGAITSGADFLSLCWPITGLPASGCSDLSKWSDQRLMTQLNWQCYTSVAPFVFVFSGFWVYWVSTCWQASSTRGLWLVPRAWSRSPTMRSGRTSATSKRWVGARQRHVSRVIRVRLRLRCRLRLIGLGLSLAGRVQLHLPVWHAYRVQAVPGHRGRPAADKHRRWLRWPWWPPAAHVMILS